MMPKPLVIYGTMISYWLLNVVLYCPQEEKNQKSNVPNLQCLTWIFLSHIGRYFVYDVMYSLCYIDVVAQNKA